jgi:hypothetical protein
MLFVGAVVCAAGGWRLATIFVLALFLYGVFEVFS